MKVWKKYLFRNAHRTAPLVNSRNATSCSCCTVRSRWRCSLILKPGLARISEFQDHDQDQDLSEIPEILKPGPVHISEFSISVSGHASNPWANTASQLRIMTVFATCTRQFCKWMKIKPSFDLSIWHFVVYRRFGHSLV